MAKFVVGEPIVTGEPVVVVDGGIKPGTHVFTLVVEDDAGNVSTPASATVRVALLGQPAEDESPSTTEAAPA
jgi:hypothetical protein